ncbi:hypothetical protein Ddc_12327 [Ditylenchus destructor]|nr:hypothetical protein Ddc_12327 [Ditylenchus destructor]
MKMKLPNNSSSREKQELIQPSNEEQNISQTAREVADVCISIGLSMASFVVIFLMLHLALKGPSNHMLPLNSIQIAVLVGFFMVYTLSALAVLLLTRIVGSKLSRPLAWMRKRKNPVILPSETLIHILHYFPRKQLVNQFSRVNSSFFRVANSLPNLHIISDDNIRFLPQVKYSSNPLYSSNPVDNELKTQSFQCIVLCNGKEYWNDGRLVEYSIDANELEKYMPRWYVRFPSFVILGIPDEALLQFLRQTKQNFSNCFLLFNANSAVSMEFVEKPQELLTDIFLDARAIDLTFHNVQPGNFLKLNGVRNCDKVSMGIGNNSSFSTRQSTDAFIEWLDWKQHDPGSRRHLVLNALNFVRGLVDGLKQAFKTATKPLNYVVTFVDHRTGELCMQLDEFELENDSTGERLSLFHDKGNYSFRLWRRIVTPDDSAWLAALTTTLIDPKSDAMVYTGEIPNTEGIDKTFYDYYNSFFRLVLRPKNESYTHKWLLGDDWEYTNWEYE